MSINLKIFICKYAIIPFSTNQTSRRHWLVIIALFLIVMVGILFRFDDLGEWRRTYESEAFYNNQPIHTTADAWFYLGLSQDLLADNYQPIDEKRGVPDSPPRQWPPPLLSVLVALIAKITGISLAWAGAVIPALLGAPAGNSPLFSGQILRRNDNGSERLRCCRCSALTI